MKLRLSVLVIWMIILFGVLLAPLSQLGFTNILPLTFNDNIIHFILFFITVVVIIFCTRLLWTFKARVFTGVAITAFISISTEVIQMYVPTRFMSVTDFLANLGGLTFGTIIYLLLHKVKRFRSFI